MNSKQALYVRTIAESGTITAAAKRLYISQPSLSQTLHQIEQELGMPLFDRSSSPFHLTYAGERYLKAAESILNIEEKLKAELESIRHEDGGRLRLGISVTRAMQVLPEVIPYFSKAYPNVTLELKECPSASLEEALQKGQIDLALAAIETSETHMTYELIERETIGILAGKDAQIARQTPSGVPVHLRAAENDGFVYLDPSHSSRIIQDKLFRRYGFHPNIILQTSSLEVARRVTLRTGGCMLIPNVYVDDYVSQCGGSFYPLADYENHRHFYACYRKGETLPKYSRDFIHITSAVLASKTSRDNPSFIEL